MTGANSGLGLETARALTGAGASLIAAARTMEKAGAAAEATRGVEAAPGIDVKTIAKWRWRDLAAAFGAGVVACGLWRFDLGWTAAGMPPRMAARIWFVDRMILAETGNGGQT
ncbi:MAG: hypothetical protein ACTSYE_09190 [Alphaproteobacteria bacterium]